MNTVHSVSTRFFSRFQIQFSAKWFLLPVLLAFALGGFSGCDLMTPVEAFDQTVTTKEETPITFELDAKNKEGGTFVVTITSWLTNGTMDLQTGSVNSNYLMVTYTPTADWSGTDSFSYSIKKPVDPGGTRRRPRSPSTSPALMTHQW